MLCPAEDGSVLESIKHVGSRISRRIVLPGRPYPPLPPSGKPSLWDAPLPALESLWATMPVPLTERGLLEAFGGMSPFLAEYALAMHDPRRALFGIVDAEVASQVCPLFFRLGQGDALACLCAATGLVVVEQHRIDATMEYADADAACRAAFVGGPVALAWQRFDAAARERVQARYLESLSAWRHGTGYRVPGEFVVVSARAA